MANERGEANSREWVSPEVPEFLGLQAMGQAAPGAVLPTNEWPLPSLPPAPVSAFWSWGDIAAAASLFRHPVPSLCSPPTLGHLSSG